MKFSEKLKALREAKGYTQDEIASKLNIARQSVSKWEQGINEPDFDTTKRLCKILDCTISELIDSDKEIITTKEEKQEKYATNVFKLNIGIAIFVILMTLTIVMAASDTVVINWDMSGNVTFGSRWFILINLIPISIVLMLAVIMRNLTSKNKLYYDYKLSFQIIPLVVSIVLVILTIVLGVITLVNYNRGEHALFNLIISGLFSIIVAVGPFTHSRFNKRNPLFGFRTNFTLSNEEGWYKVNAFASITLTLAGLIGYILTLIFIDKSWTFSFIGVIFLAFIPCVIYHEIWRKKLKKQN